MCGISGVGEGSIQRVPPVSLQGRLVGEAIIAIFIIIVIDDNDTICGIR